MSTELVVGALLGASLQVVFDRLASRQVLNFFRGRKLDETLNKLKEKLLPANVVVDDAEQKQFSNSYVKAWLDAVNDAMFDEEDTLNEIDYEFCKCEFEAECESQTCTCKVVEFHEPLSSWELVKKTKKQKFGEWVNNNARDEIVENYQEGQEEALSRVSQEGISPVGSYSLDIINNNATYLEVSKGKNKKENMYGLGQSSNEFIGSSSGQPIRNHMIVDVTREQMWKQINRLNNKIVTKEAEKRSMEAKITELMQTTEKQGEMLQDLLQHLQIQPLFAPPYPSKHDTNDPN